MQAGQERKVSAFKFSDKAAVMSKQISTAYEARDFALGQQERCCANAASEAARDHPQKRLVEKTFV